MNVISIKKIKKKCSVYDISVEWNHNYYANWMLVHNCDDKLSKKMVDALCKCDCDILVGMSWTPDRQELDLNDMQLIFWPHVSVWEYQELPDSIIHNVYKRSSEETMDIDYTNWHTQRESIIANKKRFKAVTDKITEIKNWSFLTLLLLDRMEEIERYREQFPEAIVITGKTKIKDDETWIEKLKKKGGLVIGSIKKMYRWVDVPECDSVIVASPIRFENTVIQAIGRALRRCEWKTKVQINIINDNTLQSQRYEQSKACKAAYWILPQIVYI